MNKIDENKCCPLCGHESFLSSPPEMSVEEIKNKIVLNSPAGRPISYDRNFKKNQLNKRIEDFSDWKQMWRPSSPERFLWEFSNRQLGKTTDIIIEALHNMSTGKSVFIVTHNQSMQKVVLRYLISYTRQLKIELMYAKYREAADIVLIDNCVEDIKILDNLETKK